MLKKFYGNNYFYFGLFLLGGGVLSSLLCFDLTWDFANYHYFNAWAFINDRVGYDFLVAGINTYFNPLIDVPLYYLVENFNDYPLVIFFVQGLWAGTLAFVFYKFLRLFFDVNNWQGRLSIFMALLIGITSWPFFMQIGSSTNEIQSSLVVMCGFYLLFKELFKAKEKQRLWIFAASGLILGAAMGLKLTAVIYCLSSGLSLIICHRILLHSFKTITVFAVCGLIGFLLVNGFWMLKLWQLYDNPFFPFLNNIFHSDYYNYESYRDENYLPLVWWGYLIHPLYMAFVNEISEGKMLIIDIREGLIYFILVAYFIIWLKNKDKNINNKRFVLFVFLVVSYAVWLVLFCIYRYSIPINLMASVVMIWAFVDFMPKGDKLKIIYISVANIILFSLLSTPYYSDVWSHHNYKTKIKPDVVFSVLIKDDEYKQRFNEYEQKGQYAEIEDIDLPDNTLIMMHHIPGASILPVLSHKIPNIRGVLVKGGRIHALTGFNNEKIVPEIKSIISSHQGLKVYLIAMHEESEESKYSIDAIESKGMKCIPLINNMFPWVLCVPKGTEKQIFKGIKQ